MGNPNRVASDTQDSFGLYRAAAAFQVSVSSTGNTVAVLPILDGGLTPTTGSFIVRRISVSNPANTAGGAVQTLLPTQVSIITSSDGNTSNAVASSQNLTNITAVNTFQDLNIATTYLSTAVTVPALYVKVNTAGAASHVVSVKLFGEVVQF